MDSPDGQNISSRTPGSEETRLRLLRAAAELIAELGWGRVTTRAVATRAGLPHGAVSYHFRGKQELLTDAALRVFDEAFPIVQLQALQQLPDLVAIFEPWLGEQSEEQQLVSRVGIEAMLEAERNPTLRQRLAEMLHDFRAAVTDIVKAGQQRGTAPPDVSPEGLATLLGAVGDGIFLHARLDPDLDATAALEALRALLTAPR
jgi:AcrR family transcriptional regulator